MEEKMNEDNQTNIWRGPQKFNTTQIVNCLLRKSQYKEDEDAEEYTSRPSEYMKQMLMTTDEMTQYILKWKNRFNLPLCMELEASNFEVSPSIIVFQQFTPGISLSVTVTVRNASAVPRYLRSSYEPDPFFSVDFCGSSYLTMLAPGISNSYRVKFMPDRNQDYHYQLKFATDSGDLIVPVVAINARGILDFPDRIEVPLTGVKIPSSKTIFVRNIGGASTVFTLYTDNPCFWIEPSKGRMEEEESLQFTIHFLSNKAGDFEGNLFLECETEEKLRIELRCSTENCPIRIDRGSIRMEDTFLGLSRSKILTIHNRSNYIVKYKWMQLESIEADNERREHYKKLFHLVYESELNRCVDLVHYNVCTPDIHQLVYQRIYTDELESLTKETFQYNHICFMFAPEEAEIWPQSSTDVTIFFRALEVGEVTSTAYLEVTGREDRIPLTLYGTGKGPVFRLNVLTISLENIYMCSVHNYEIIAANKGHIPGTLIYRAKPTDFGGKIDVTPLSLKLQPDEYKSFNLSFSSNRKGDFVERVDFVVKESLEVLSLHIKGCIICPTLHFDKECLDFGTTALGFSTRQDVYLNNLALIPVAFTITVLNDGDQVPLLHEDYAKAQTKPSFPSKPREFQVAPQEGVVAAHGSMKIKVIYTANIARVGQTTIQVDMWDSDSDPVTLPMKFCGKVASLSIVPREITIQFCFTNFPYSRSFAVENTSDLDSYFYFIPQQVSDNSAVICSLCNNQGYVKAHQSKTIEAVIITKTLGSHKIMLNMLVMGEPPSVSSYVVIRCNGQGPVVSAQPSSLDFGEMKVLEEKSMEFQLINDSPIPTQFIATLKSKDPVWSVSPESGDLEPHESMIITVKLCLVDSGKYKDKIMLRVINSRTIPVEVKGTGYGCSVVFEPQIFPTFDWGLLFSHQQIDRTITLTNKGTHDYQMIWITEPEVRFRRGQMLMSHTTKFQLYPSIVNIPPGETRHVYCKLFWKANECVVEKWNVFGQFHGIGKRELIGTSSFTVTLTEPQILFSKRRLTFRVDVCPEEDKLQQTDELLVTNQSKLDLNVQLSVKEPFHLITSSEEHVQSMQIVLIDGGTTKIRVFFSFNGESEDRYSKNYSGVLRLEYQEHPNQDKITCKGYVNFPNLDIQPSDFVINCELGTSGEEILTLTNNGPVSVVYKFLWLADSIDIQRDSDVVPECSGCSSRKGKLEADTAEMQEVEVADKVEEDIYTSDKQDGVGDGPLDTIPPPTNSPISENQNSEIPLMEEISDIDDCLVSAEEIRNFLLPIVGSYFKTDEDLLALESMQTDPPRNHYINEMEERIFEGTDTLDMVDRALFSDPVLKIVPNEGTVLPYSVQRVYVGFHGFERLRIKATIVCEIFRGPTERIHLLARADAIRYAIDTNVIDFGQQLFLEYSHSSFVLRNLCTIGFDYEIKVTKVASNEAIDRFDIYPLIIQPDGGFVDAESVLEFRVDHLPTMLGPIGHRFQLEIGHLMPVTIEVIAYGAFPQVYPCIPRGKMHQYHSIELEYSAIQSLTEDFIVKKIENIVAKKINDLLETDMEMLAAEEWCIIPYDETFPRTMDIDMAIERWLARKFVDANSYILMQHATTRRNEPIPQLFSSEHVIDMKHVIIERTAHYSANVINYGPWNVEMRIKMENKKDNPKRSGIIVHFRKHSKLLVGDSAVLQVAWHPTRERFSEKSTEVKHMIYIEVLYGCTIPVTIKGIVTYPYVTVNTKFLDFQDVVVGECLVLHILIKNDGLVDCEWEARLSDVHHKKQHEDYPFYVEYDTNYCPPGHFEIVRVYFKPRKTCYIEARLKIIVKMSPETQIVAISGRGIEKRLNIIEPTIQFLPTIPYTNIQEVVFTIENTCNYPVEFFWHHLDDVFQMEDHVTKALLYYYRVKEILLPPRKPGESIPWQLTKFYRDIINEMAQALIMEKLNEEELFEGEVQLERSHEGDTGKKRERMTRSSVLKRKTRKRGRSIQQSTTRKSSVRESSRRGKRNEVVSDLSSTDSDRKDCPDFSILNETLLESLPLPTSDPEEIQQMLFGYIDSLYKSSDFQSRMKDPVKELFENIQRKSDVSNNLPDPSKPEKRVCVIFHGAPFTEYQEVACRSARVLEIPVLSIDKAITEVTAFTGSPCSIQLRQIIDETYEIYSEAFVKQKQRLISQDARESNEVGSESTRRTGTSSKRRSSPKEKSSRTGESPKTPKKLKTSKSTKIQSSDAQGEAILRLHADPDPLAELDKIPTNEKLEMLDALSRYEYKIQAIFLLQKIVDHRDIHDSPRDRGDRSLRKKKDSFLGITSELIAEALEERLSMEDFKRGFVVQSLECNFLRNNTLEALLSLLRIVGNIEYLLFVTFLNSMACYDTRVEQLQKEIAMKATDPNQKIQDIDEMSSSEYDQLPDEDKKMYLDAILPLKRAEASRRRARFIERMMERTKKKESRSYVSSLKTTKKKRNAKTRHATAASNSRPASSKRGTSKATRSRDSSKRRKESVSSEVKEITVAMDRYYKDLSSIEAVIRNWDPIKKTIEAASTTKSKASRSARSKDVSPLDTVQEVSANNFHIWYVRSSDPWQDTMYDLVVARMNENLLARSALPVEIIPVPDLRPKLYSVLRWKDVEKRVKKIPGDVYQLVSLTSMPEIFSVNESNAVSEVSVQENYSIAKRNRRRRGRKTTKTEEQKSLSRAENRSVNASTIESKDTNNASFLETIREESLKPRWILLPSESQRFKIRFQPEESGHYEETYALTLLDGNYVTYEVNVTGVADIPRLDMNPKTIFARTANAKLNETESSTYFYDKQLYDFGPQLVLRKDRRPHRREARLKFCNISEVEVEVRVSLTEDDSQCFFVQPQQLLIARGSCATLILSAIATRLGIITGKLFLCVTNNPKVEVIELQSKGTMLDIELDEKELSFGRILLYRIEYRTLTIRSKTPVPFFWYLEAEEPADPQITFTPFHGVIETRSEQKIEFCYHATTVGVVRKKAIIFKAFLDEDDNDPIFYDVVLISGETYDVAVDINYANPIDLKYIRVNFAAKTTFSMRNRGDYEVKYVITVEDKEKLAKLNLSANFKKKLEIEPTIGTVPPNQEKTVEMIFKPKTELTLKEAPILKCHLVDTHKETTIIAEIPLNVSLIAYYTRFRINPYPVVNFGALAMCTEKTMYLNIENIGKFPLHYSIRLLHKHPSDMYMTKPLPKEFPKKASLVERRTASKKGKKSARSVKIETKIHPEPEILIIGSITIMKTEGTVDVDQTDSIAISCYPEFVGSQEEQIVIVVDDSIPEDREGKTVTLSMNSYIPTIDFQDLDSTFQENRVVDRIQDFDCPKDIGAHTVFARQEKSLYFRYINVLSTHVTCFKLYNRGVVAANVEIHLLEESLMPNTAKSNTFIVEPTNDQIPPMSHKVFTVSFTPHIIETFQETFRAAVVLPSHLEADQLFIKLIGESCVPEVAITEPVHGARERPTLNFPRTLIDESSYRYLALENIGFIKAKIIVKIDEDLNNVFLFSACSDTQHLLQIWEDYCDEPRDRCIVVRLAPGNVARFKVIFAPTEIGKYHGKIRLHVIDNPYENMSTNLEGECYVEPIVLDGLQFEENKRKVVTGNHKVRRVSSKQNSLVSASSNSMHSASLTYILDYGLCFVSKMYKKTFKIANKSRDRWFRFQWSTHPRVVFEPSIGHIKYLTCKEIVVTFLAPEPANYENIRIECSICEILVEYSEHELVGWDDRQTEVRWERIHHDLMDRLSNINLLLKKIVEPTIEAKHEILAGTNRSIHLLLNAIVAFSECSCTVQEICFNDTLMFQTREYKFFLSNPGIVDTVFAWKINMDEQYPKRYIGDSSNVTSRPRTAEETRSQHSRSSRGIFSATSELGRRNFGQNESSAGVNMNILSRRCMSFVSNSVDMKDYSNAKQSDLFSSTAGLSGRTTDSWLEGDDLPFVIYPETGTISSGQSVECTLKFSPKDVFYYKAYLTCNIENQESKQPNLIISIVARSLLPYCHFDVQDSDYVTSGRRDPSLPGPLGYEIDDPTLWQNIRVIEFKVVGVAGTHVKKFHLINPTVDDYYFSWTNRSPLGPDEISNFHCAVTEGIAERGKRTDLAFTFLAENVGVFESFWLFSIDRYNLECLFLLVGIVTEPSVYCLTIHVKLKPTILGFNVRDSLKILNNEDFHIPFSVLEESLYSEGKFQKLSVTPMTGTLISKSEQHFWVEYHPTQVGEFHFSIQCAVKLMKNPLTMFVTASVYDIVSSVSYCKLNGEIVRASESKENVIDLGKITPEVPINLKFDITNACKVAFYYAWELGMTPEISCRNAYSVTTSQKQGHVTSEDRSACYLTLTTYQKVTIKDHCVLLKISNGPTYKFTLKATSRKPAIEFSFNRYDFGPCYIQKHNAISYYAELRLTNSDDAAFIIECKFEEQPHLSIDLNSISEALAARSTITIPIVFRPLKEIKYHECLVFTINSVNEKRITIIGEGIGYKVRLVNPRDQSIDLGNVPARKSVVRKIPVINEGLAPLDLRFGIMKYLNGFDEYREGQRYCDPSDDDREMAQASIVEIKRSWTVDQRFATGEPKLLDVLKIEPSSSVVLKPNKRVNVLVTFKSPSRIRLFDVKVAFQSSSMILPLFSVRGSCVGAEFRLNRNHIPFGTVVQGCTEESKVILMNTGDLGSRFKWNTSKLPKDFQITPMSGYCTAGMDVSFTVKFQPPEQRNLIEGEAVMEIEKYESLRIKISGACCKLPDPIETIAFECLVREKQTRSVVITNDSIHTWKLKVEVTGDYFSVDETLQVPSQQFAPCIVTYSPLVMNSENTLHMGTLVLKSQDENLYLLYFLRGRSLPPRVTEEISRQFPAKTRYTELLPVHNWLNTQQRFQCKIELLRNDNAQSQIPLYSFVGNERIDVPPNSQRDYRAVFYCYEKWNFYFKVTFTNEEKEYQFYEMEYEVTEPEVIESIKLATPARSQICYALKLENPLERETIKFTAECLHPFVTVTKVSKIVQPLSHEYITIIYHPTMPFITDVVMLNVDSEKLGRFPYELRLKASPAPPEKTTRVNAALGSNYAFSLPVKNFTRDNAIFLIHVDSECFACPKNIQVNELSEGIIDVIYEPYDVENATATLIASSDTAGEFIFPLIGSCSLPKPMGPYVIARSSPAFISFKNVFREAKTFDFIVDVAEIFTVDTASTTLDSKQSIDVKVGIRKDELEEEDFKEEKYPVTGKLTAYCTDHAFSHINWVYYLRAVFE